MKFEAILFDLDGTLLPMDNDIFVKGYLEILIKSVENLGYTFETLIPVMWKGVEKMTVNNGEKSNCSVFWSCLADTFGDRVYNEIPVFDEFYKTEFNNAKAFTNESKISKEIVDRAKKIADKVILATNPLFPRVAVNTRLSWVGLSDSDFDYVTDYENSSYCKPNPKYYETILNKFNLNAERCIMIGNNVEEDIISAKSIGLDTYLVTDCLICKGDKPDTAGGSLQELLSFLQE